MAPDINDSLPSSILKMLSEKGREVYFPKLGILSQAAEAKGKTYNATLGVANEEDGTIMGLPSVTKQVNLDPSKILPYVNSFGRPDLRKSWREMIYKKNPSLGDTNISLPVVTNALTHGLGIAGHLFLNSGEKLITPSYYWGNYRIVFEHWHGAKITTFPTFEGPGFNVAGLREMLLAEGDKKVVLLNFPNNPSGYTPINEEVKTITAAILEAAEAGKNVVIIIDDAYFGLVYEEGVFTESIFVKLANLHERVLAVKIDGATKEDYVWGLRVGFMTYAYKGMTDEAAEALADKTGGAIRGNVSNCSNCSQSIMYEAYQSDTYEAEKREKYETLQARYKKVRETLSAHPEYEEVFTPLPFNSGYFMCIKLKDGLDSEKLRQELLNRYDTGVIVMPGLLRLAFASIPLPKIDKLFENIYLAAKDL